MQLFQYFSCGIRNGSMQVNAAPRHSVYNFTTLLLLSKYSPDTNMTLLNAHTTKVPPVDFQRTSQETV